MEEENLSEYTQNVKSIFEMISSAYTQGFAVSDAVPTSMRSEFYAYMENYNGSMATVLARLMTSALLGQIESEEIEETMAEQVARLPNIVNNSNDKYASYLTLTEMEDYPFYLLVAELDEKTCDVCSSQGGRVYNITELEDLSLIPPFHPNCRCSLVAMDKGLFWGYTLNMEGYYPRGWYHGHSDTIKFMVLRILSPICG